MDKLTVTMKVVKIDNKFNKPTAHIEATISDGKLFCRTQYLYADVTKSTKVDDEHEYTQDEFKALNIVQKESKSNPGRFYNVVTL
jgi:hypothetical protein